jgi:hypothetical protein
MDDRANFDEILLWHDPMTGGFGSFVRHCVVVSRETMSAAGSSKVDGRSKVRMTLADGTVITGHVWVIAASGQAPPAGAQEVEPEVYEQIVADAEARKQADLERLSTVQS